MSNFHITYNHPWLLLLIIPALLLTLIPYLRLEKKHRCTRNRVLSMSMHIAAMVLAINLLAGLAFSYEVPNTENEVIILVDVSDSSEKERESTDELVRSIVGISPLGCRIGIVKFGYGYEYAVELTDERESIMDKYMLSNDPDTTATALADALTYSASLFTNKKTSKIVVISDGFETDGDAFLALGDILGEGTVVDAVPINTEVPSDVEILSVSFDRGDIVVGESFVSELTITCNSLERDEAAILRLYDNGELYGESPVSLKNGENRLPVSLTLTTRGLHELSFEIVTDFELFGDPLPDDIKNNNVYRAYVDIREFKNILLIERYENEASVLKDILSKNKNVTDISIESDIDMIPKTLGEMAEYEQIILVNVAYSDMPSGFEGLLHRYVYELGGGLFTVGGKNDEVGGAVVPHAYNRADIDSSVYLKQMLPVTAEDYTPPIAVMIVVDTSTSMKSNGKLDSATDGAKACLDALHDRDFCGVMSFSSASTEKLSVLPVSNRTAITEAILKVKDDKGGGTMFSDAIMKAGRALALINNVERRHIILVTDGLPNDSYDDYSAYIDDNMADGITMSVVTVGLDSALKESEMQKTANAGGGKFYNVSDAASLSGIMYKDLTEEAIPEIEYGREFELRIKDKSPIFTGIDQGAIPSLSGYYGTVAKKGATVPLMGKYVPIYATHEYGKGKVGSFMCDLNGEWSAAFIEDVVGIALITNIVESLFPSEDVRAEGVRYETGFDNYLHWVNLHGVPEEATADIFAEPVSNDLQHLAGLIEVRCVQKNGRYTFEIKEPGLYSVTILITDENGEIVDSVTDYIAFSYSEEYTTFSPDITDGEARIESLAEKGGGVTVTDPVDVFSGFKKTLTEVYDPKFILIISAIVLILLDIAVRKFKFKWLHEIIRERRTAE
ncbi:MAG: VWA domain-containing protein [Ruminococcaceae bacterium]|nr:VWA domain-containing protein [Oscillospiraceae bacterium]